MKSSHIILFSDCIPVKGINRSIICDTKNNNYFFIPNGLYDILETYNGKTIETIKEDFNHEYDEIIDEYFDFLVENKLVFFNANPNLFPKIDLQWHSPSIITNAIIDFDEIIHDYKEVIKQFEVLKCSYVQMRFFKTINLDFINKIVQYLNNEKSRIVSIDFIIPYNETFSIEALNELIAQNSRIHAVIIYNSPITKSYNPINENMGYILQVERNILNEKHCGIINTEYFYSNINLFSESQNHNSCLNRKISIDKEGNIKNCPSMPQNFGNIKDTTLEEALSHKDFKKFWNITKDQIDVCKDCEFRHICTDCRAYVEEPENHYSKPLKCGYNPYTNEWEEWSTNPLKQKAIKYYGMQDLISKK
ncbi:grasp-with-spasm system SPASM domain peptide maturase [Flavobacterium jejuense]|uniref:Grasp-with-spasm system SPASM domain peptide maturase n=1 Tax=Flavobacterium jejuense TaxID=1544455 RepID=A0ABX0INT5_9FLAO|nr:grasp-with-spasm system SPASM domain peptide maturase [Flavobacterium jejuense]NHN24612.1 grasp-with-spasm system SPASM domain peptide maturase [Flavobacterium jejuense]